MPMGGPSCYLLHLRMMVMVAGAHICDPVSRIVSLEAFLLGDGIYLMILL